MTTTASRPPAPAAPPAAAPPPVSAPATGSVLSRRIAATRASVRDAFSGSPGRLRLLGAAAIAVSLLGGVLGGFALQQRAASLQQAQSDTAQLVRVQSIMINLVKADAAATTAYLVGGLEPPAQRAQYDTSLARAAAGIAEASRANAADTRRLAEVNQAVTRYAGLVEAARVNNREGFPVGQAYIRQASELLRGGKGALPALAAVVDRTAERVDGAYGRGTLSIVLLAVAGLLVLGGLVGVQVSLAQRSHRYLNVPLAAGALVLVVVTVVGVFALVSAQNRANDVRDGAYANTIALAQARIVAFDAKTNESLSLINRGSGASFEPVIEQRVKDATGLLRAAGVSTAELAAWAKTDTALRAEDVKGNWDSAVKTATTESNTMFTGFDNATSAALSQQSDTATSELAKPRPLLLVLAALLVLAGIVAAVASWAGVSVRLEEYR